MDSNNSCQAENNYINLWKSEQKIGQEKPVTILLDNTDDNIHTEILLSTRDIFKSYVDNKRRVMIYGKVGVGKNNIGSIHCL